MEICQILSEIWTFKNYECKREDLLFVKYFQILYNNAVVGQQGIEMNWTLV